MLDSRQQLNTISADKTTVSRDEEGYLIDPDDWSPEMSLALAAEEGSAFTDEHWIIVMPVRNTLSSI